MHLGDHPCIQASVELKRYFAKMQGEANLILALSQTLKSDSDLEQELRKAEKKLGIKAQRSGLVRDLLKLIQCIQTFP